MIDEPDRHRIGKARLLRRQGKTYSEIREVVGSVGDNDAASIGSKAFRRPAEHVSRPSDTEAGKGVSTTARAGPDPRRDHRDHRCERRLDQLWVREVTVPTCASKRIARRTLKSCESRAGDARRGRARQHARVEAARAIMSDVDGCASYSSSASRSTGRREAKTSRGVGRTLSSSSTAIPTVHRGLPGLARPTRSPDAGRQYRLSIHESADVKPMRLVGRRARPARYALSTTPL